jgi:hypothetical protein
VKVLSIDQPWATLIMLGVKRYETRGAPPNGDTRPEGVRGLPGCTLNRGEWIGIASTTRTPPVDTILELGDYEMRRSFTSMCRPSGWELSGPNGLDVLLPFGKLLGTATFRGAHPMLDERGWQHDTDTPDSGIDVSATDALVRIGPGAGEADISDELPYGYWEHGRWAWELADVDTLDEPIPVVGRQGVWEWNGEARA